MADSLASKVLARHKQADGEHNPDPLTFKAFLSDFEQGVKRGQEMVPWSPSGHWMEGDSPPAMNELVVVKEKIAGAAKDLLELARRIENLASRGNLAINERRLAAKMSGILSTLFYQTGVANGIKDSVGHDRTAGRFDPSILGYRPEDLEGMSPDEKEAAIFDCLMQAADLLEQTTRAFDQDLTPGDLSAVRQAAKSVIQIAKRRQ